jgi:hypothetical protein
VCLPFDGGQWILVVLHLLGFPPAEDHLYGHFCYFLACGNTLKVRKLTAGVYFPISSCDSFVVFHNSNMCLVDCIMKPYFYVFDILVGLQVLQVRPSTPSIGHFCLTIHGISFPRS